MNGRHQAQTPGPKSASNGLTSQGLA